MKKEYKKILVNGEAIQNEKGNIEEENKQWLKQLNKALNKYNLIDCYAYYIKTTNGDFQAINLDNILERIASKNLCNVYLTNNNTIKLVNEYNTTIEIIKGLTQNEYYDYIDKQ